MARPNLEPSQMATSLAGTCKVDLARHSPKQPRSHPKSQESRCDRKPHTLCHPVFPSKIGVCRWRFRWWRIVQGFQSEGLLRNVDPRKKWLRSAELSPPTPLLVFVDGCGALFVVLRLEWIYAPAPKAARA